MDDNLWWKWSRMKLRTIWACNCTGKILDGSEMVLEGALRWIWYSSWDIMERIKVNLYLSKMCFYFYHFYGLDTWPAVVETVGSSETKCHVLYFLTPLANQPKTKQTKEQPLATTAGTTWKSSKFGLKKNSAGEGYHRRDTKAADGQYQYPADAYETIKYLFKGTD